MYKPLFPAIYPLETSTIKSKQSDEMKFLNKKESLSPVFDNVFKICCDELNSLK